MGHVPKFIMQRMFFQVGVSMAFGIFVANLWEARVHKYNARVNDYYKQLYASHPELLHVSRNPTKVRPLFSFTNDILIP